MVGFGMPEPLGGRPLRGRLRKMFFSGADFGGPGGASSCSDSGFEGSRVRAVRGALGGGEGPDGVRCLPESVFEEVGGCEGLGRCEAVLPGARVLRYGSDRGAAGAGAVGNSGSPCRLSGIQLPGACGRGGRGAAPVRPGPLLARVGSGLKEERRGRFGRVAL